MPPCSLPIEGTGPVHTREGWPGAFDRPPIVWLVRTNPRRSALTLFAMAVAFLLPVAFSPSVHAVFWAPKAALIPLLAAVGLPLLLRLARSRGPARPPARASLAFIGVASLSTLFADNHTTAIFGPYFWGTGLIFVIALGGAWAVGISLDTSERSDVTRALLAGVVVNVVLALAEMVTDLSRFELARYDGRSIGLMGNPVHLGAIAAGGIALVLPLRGEPLWRRLLLVTAIAAGVEVSGSRSALLALAVVLWLGARTMASRLGWRRVGLAALAVAIGLSLGSVLAHHGGGLSVSGRVTATDGGGGITPRLSLWWATRHAVADNPLLGSGPGTYRQATSRHRTTTVARAFGADRQFVDAHNLAVEYAATTGLLGLSTGLIWLTLAWRRSEGVLRLFAAGILVVGLTEPQSPGTTPLALLALGMACAPRCRPAPDPTAVGSSAVRVSTVGLALVATTASLIFLVGQFHLDQAVLDFDRGHADRAITLLPRWSLPAGVRARIETFEGRSERDPTKLALAEHWQREAIRRDPTDPSLWLILGDAAASEGRGQEARSAYLEALEHNPVSTRACNGLAEQEILSGDIDRATLWLRRSLAIEPRQPKARSRLDSLERRHPRSP